MDAYHLTPSALATHVMKYGDESAEVTEGFNVVRLGAFPGRKSDVIVINPFMPLLLEQFEANAAKAPPPEPAATAAGDASSGMPPPPPYTESGGGSGEVVVMLWSLRMDESLVPWAVFHSHVVGCSDPVRARPPAPERSPNPSPY